MNPNQPMLDFASSMLKSIQSKNNQTHEDDATAMLAREEAERKARHDLLKVMIAEKKSQGKDTTEEEAEFEALTELLGGVKVSDDEAKAVGESAEVSDERYDTSTEDGVRGQVYDEIKAITQLF